MLRPRSPRPLVKPQGPNVLDAVHMVDHLVQVVGAEIVAALGGRLEPLEVVPMVDVAVLDAPVEVRLDVVIFVVY